MRDRVSQVAAMRGGRGSRWAVGCALAVLLLACGEGGEVNPAPVGPRDVRLVLDDAGITHVYGPDDEAVLFGAGYAMARDRLFQMDLFRRRALGKQAEVLGKDGVDNDVAARTFRFRELGDADAARCKQERPGDYRLVEAWARGVNARIAEVSAGHAPLPYGFGPEGTSTMPDAWEASNAFAIGKLLSFGLSSSLEPELLATALTRLAPKFVDAISLVQPGFDTFTTQPGAPSIPKQTWHSSSSQRSGVSSREIDPVLAEKLSRWDGVWHRPVDWMYGGMASNNWGITATHSSNGRPFLAGDPHQPLTSPIRMWPLHLSSVEGGGSLDVTGFAFVGTPVVELGHNAHVGWTATTNFADVMDMWDVTFNDAQNALVLAGHERPFVRRPESIRVKNKDGGFDLEDIEFIDVPGFGVLLPEALLPIPMFALADGQGILFNWTGFAPTRELQSYLAMDRARDIDEYTEAVNLLDVGAGNYVAADASTLLYHVHAQIPDRGDPSSHPMPMKILSSQDGASLWTGAMLDKDRIPHLRDPASGFLGTANNDPWGFTRDGTVENDPWYYGSFYDKGLRAARIEQRLTDKIASGEPVDRAFMEGMQGDTHSMVADVVVPKLGEAVAAIPSDPMLSAFQGRDDLVGLANALSSWDRSYHADGGESLAYLGLVWFAARAAMKERMGSLLFPAIASQSPPFIFGSLRNILDARFEGSDVFLPDGERVLLLSALDETSAWLVERFGTWDVSQLRFGDVNLAAFPNPLGPPLDPGTFEVNGGPDSLDVVHGGFFSGDQPLEVFVSKQMALYRMVIGFADDGTPEATVNFPRGTCEDPNASCFDDHHADWLSHRYRPLAFRKAEVEERKRSEMTLTYPGAP